MNSNARISVGGPCRASESSGGCRQRFVHETSDITDSGDADNPQGVSKS